LPHRITAGNRIVSPSNPDPGSAARRSVTLFLQVGCNLGELGDSESVREQVAAWRSSTMTMQATRQIMTLGRYTANVERNVLISSALFIGQ